MDQEMVQHILQLPSFLFTTSLNSQIEVVFMTIVLRWKCQIKKIVKISYLDCDILPLTTTWDIIQLDHDNLLHDIMYSGMMTCFNRYRSLAWQGSLGGRRAQSGPPLSTKGG